jgi:putative DNA primase/helicase
MPDARVIRLRRERCSIEDCDEAVDYLASRGLWPLPVGCMFWAHASAEYWHGPKRLGRYSALLADVVDVNGELVTAHVTYLLNARKLAVPDPDSPSDTLPPRKILSSMTGRTGCAVRLVPATDVLGIAEGIETALSASLLDDIPVWAAVNAGLLAKFEPPSTTQRLVIYADHDAAGLIAAIRLNERVQERVCGGMRIETRIPPKEGADWNDILIDRHNRSRGSR